MYAGRWSIPDDLACAPLSPTSIHGASPATPPPLSLPSPRSVRPGWGGAWAGALVPCSLSACAGVWSSPRCRDPRRGSWRSCGKTLKRERSIACKFGEKWKTGHPKRARQSTAMTKLFREERGRSSFASTHAMLTTSRKKYTPSDKRSAAAEAAKNCLEQRETELTSKVNDARAFTYTGCLSLIRALSCPNRRMDIFAHFLTGAVLQRLPTQARYLHEIAAAL